MIRNSFRFSIFDRPLEGAMKALTEKDVASCNSLQELLKKFLAASEEWTRQGFQSPDLIAVEIVGLVQRRLEPKNVTRTLGLRAKAVQLQHQRYRPMVDWFILEMGKRNLPVEDWPRGSEWQEVVTYSQAFSRMGLCTTIGGLFEPIKWLRRVLESANL